MILSELGLPTTLFSEPLKQQQISTFMGNLTLVRVQVEKQVESEISASGQAIAQWLVSIKYLIFFILMLYPSKIKRKLSDSDIPCTHPAGTETFALHKPVRRLHTQRRVGRWLKSLCYLICLLSLLPHVSGPWLVCFLSPVFIGEQRALPVMKGRAVLSGHGAPVPCANINGKGNSSTQLEPHWARDRDKGCVDECNLMLCLKKEISVSTGKEWNVSQGWNVQITWRHLIANMIWF